MVAKKTFKSAARIMGHDPEVWDTVLLRLVQGESLVAITADKNMPGQRTVYDRIDKDSEFAQKYAQARARQADSIAEMALHEAIKAVDPQLGRLAYDARKWFAGKVAPKKWGDSVKIENEHSGPGGKPLQVVSITTSNPVEASKIYQKLMGKP